METRLLGHTAYRTEYHLVWVTKYRRTVLNAARKKYLAPLLAEVAEEMDGCEIVECSIQPDHVHLVIIIPPKYSVSEVVGRLKGRTSSCLRKRFTRLAEVYPRGSLWSPGYFVSTVGLSEDRVLAYVRRQ